MYTQFENIEDLFGEISKDKNISGVNSFTLNRYPIRFVLFDNFRDSREFVSRMQAEFHCTLKSIGDWLDKDSDDTMITHVALANNIESFIAQAQNDQVIAPFSELARFYNNSTKNEFDALIRTIKGIEAKKQGLRIYIPIVGLEGKMEKFKNDTQSFIWYLQNVDKQLDYKLIMVNNENLKIKNLETQCSVVSSIRQWLDLWRDVNAKPTIISTSQSLFANSKYANPDNAFDFVVCNNIYQFLKDGLSLNFNNIKYIPSDENNWQRLSEEIDIQNFSFDNFFNSYFHIDTLSDYKVFLKIWFSCSDTFEKWLLSKFYIYKFGNNDYISIAINNSKSYSNSDFFTSVALSIFDIEFSEKHLEKRNFALQIASQQNVNLNEETQNELAQSLINLADNSGYATAIRYFSPLTKTEKKLAIEWLSQDNILSDNLKEIYPELYHYLQQTFGTDEQWVLDYIDKYKKAKIHNNYSDEVETIIKEKNGSQLSFDNWHNNFKTTKTLLHDRSDIEIYYWIDGLGIEWIPYIKWLIESKKNENIFLNETHIAIAHYPTTTSNNRQDLIDLSSENLKKIGDLDSHAHNNSKHFSEFIIEEFEIVRNSISQIINECNGKKIAIVSDHGLTVLSQFKDGKNLAGVESDHRGRVAIQKNGKCVSSNDYVVCDDEKTMCALNHHSLCAKVPTGQSTHGGCTPEEILVPIFIISSKENAQNWSAKLLSKEISESEPIVRYEINGDVANIYPHLRYNGKDYSLKRIDSKTFESEPLKLNKDISEVILIIDNIEQSDKITVKMSATEDDLFDF